MTETILSIEQLTIVPKAHKSRHLVDHVSMQVKAGQTTCVVGESGSGKSLTALSVMGLLSNQLSVTTGHCWFETPALGKIDLLQTDNKTMQTIRGSQIGMIFQEPMTSLNPILTIGHQIGEGLQIHEGLSGRALQSKIEDLLRLVDIPVDRAQSYPDELSGGQRQRVMIAMSIACEPRLLIADEPSTALDVTVQAQILHLLDDLKTRLQMGMLFITHDFGVVRDIADEVVVMFRGEVVESGPVKSVLDNPQHPYTKALLDCVPDAAGQKTLKPIDYAWLEASDAHAS